MRVKVFLPTMLRADAGGARTLEIELPARPTLGALLDEIEVRHPALERRLRDERGALRRYVNIYVGSEECRRLNGAETRVPEGADVRVIPSVAGG